MSSNLNIGWIISKFSYSDVVQFFYSDVVWHREAPERQIPGPGGPEMGVRRADAQPVFL